MPYNFNEVTPGNKVTKSNESIKKMWQQLNLLLNFGKPIHLCGSQPCHTPSEWLSWVPLKTVSAFLAIFSLDKNKPLSKEGIPSQNMEQEFR
jgi:hypothetical protein